MSNIEKLCEIFQVSPNVLLGYEEKDLVKAETSTFPKERKKKGLALVLLVVILNIGFIIFVLSGGLGNNEDDNRLAVDSFEVTGFYFGEVARYHTDTLCYVNYYFTPSKNGICEAQIRLEDGAHVSVKCNNGEDSKTILLLKASVRGGEVEYEEL